MNELKSDSCNSCKQDYNFMDLEVLYNLIINTTHKKTYVLRLKNFLDELADYTFSKGYHLSASQILLLRPDILKEFLKFKFKDEEVVLWYLDEVYLCTECYSKYKELVPER